MELIIKTKQSTTEPLGELLIYNFSQDNGQDFKIHTKKEMYRNNDDDIYTVFFTEVIESFNDEINPVKLEKTVAKVGDEKQYLYWLNKYIEYILVNGTFYFQCEDESQTNEEVLF